jgi:hypothetical protein
LKNIKHSTVQLHFMIGGVFEDLAKFKTCFLIVLKHIHDPCQSFWDLCYFKLCAQSETLLIFFISYYFKFT